MTAQMNESNYNELMIKDIINKLQIIKVDGETMQYILEKVGMTDQMLRQLMLTQPINDVEYVWEERRIGMGWQIIKINFVYYSIIIKNKGYGENR